ncbi:MAG TPA: ATP-dependent DNA helicase RecG [Anaeromyxobacteraceae bacterium]
MAGPGAGRGGRGGLPAGAAALEGLVAPIRFAARDGFAGLPRLAGFGETLRRAAAAARAAGAPDSPALRGLLAEAAAFDGGDEAARRGALLRVAGHLAGLLPLPADVRALARRAQLPGARASGGEAPGEEGPPPGESAGGAGPGPAWEEEGPAPAGPEPPLAPEPRDVAERARRRARLRARLGEVPGAHPAPRALLEERGRATVEEALAFWPKAYQDRTRTRRIAELRTGEEGLVAGRVGAVRTQRMRNGRPILRLALDDGSGKLDLVFFNPAPWWSRSFAVGDPLLAQGKVGEGFGGRRQMAQPEVEKVRPGDSASFGRIVPFYAGPADWQHPALRRLVKRLCDEHAALAVDDLPLAVRERRRLLPVGRALREAHFPPPGTDPEAAAARATPAFRRLVFEELFFLQLGLAQRRRGVRRAAGVAFDVAPERLGAALRRLPFALTAAQRRALDEIAGDMGRPEPMNRLLQGDVGSGKTAVAFAAAMLAVQSGWQAALMAPTEILAEQHARTLRGWLEGSGVEVALVAAQARGPGQREARRAVASGRAAVAVGTHALLEGDVEFHRLGLVVVDEQHRFGVLQRARLIGKGRRPDVLVMTATPIPRTLALAFYGDLDQSKIGELPPGRSPVVTRVYGDGQRRRAHEVLRRELDAGRRGYVVYPLVAESEKTDLADATGGAAELARILAPHPVGLLHGQMKPGEKDAAMERFRRGEVRVLVATTVVEVGVDVPEAAVMLVEHAERFGLSQLHQLRGRVGRGAAQGHCLLVAHFGRAGGEARERLRVMERTQDGFEIARADLRIRGPGEMLGTRQAGQPYLEIADLYRDEAILDEAREEAFALVEADPELARPEHAAAREALEQRWAGRLSLAQVG